MKRVEITAHRGASHDAPENTLAAIDLAWRQGADAVEIDIHLCRSGGIAVLHDSDTLRVAGVDKPVAGQSWQELRCLDFGSWKHPRFAGEKMPSLDEVIQTLAPGKRLQIEVKCGPEVIPALRDSLARCGKSSEHFILTSFSYPTLQKLKAAFPSIPTFWIQTLSKAAEPDALQNILAPAQKAGFEGVNFGLAEHLDVAIVPAVKAANLQLCVWPVDSVELARRWIEAGVDIITTNRPGELCSQLYQ